MIVCYNFYHENIILPISPPALIGDIFITLIFCRAMNGLFTYVGEHPGSSGVNVNGDFILLGLLNGSVYLEFNNIGGLHSVSVINSSSQLYNDGELHRLNFTFNGGRFMFTVDGTNYSPQPSKIIIMLLEEPY